MENPLNIWDITSWIPAVSTTALLAFAMWLFRSLISTRLTKSVENEFDSKLEKLMSELRTNEAKIEALRSGALSGLISRQSMLYEKQLEAIEQIWDAMTELRKGKGISATMAIVKFEESAKEASKNIRFRQIFEQMESSFSIKNINLDAAEKARPFLSQLAWAYYNAYKAIIIVDALKLEALKLGIESPQKYFKLEEVTNIIKAVLPHQTDYLNRWGSNAHHYLLDELESLLLAELKNMQKGADTDKENAQRAAEILKESEKLMTSIKAESAKD